MRKKLKISKKEFLVYIKADLKMRNQQVNLITFIKDPIARFHLYMRLLELLQGSKVCFLFFVFIKIIFLRLSVRLGFSIPINTLAKGVHIPHYGTIVINENSRIGEYSVINVGVVIGRHPKNRKVAPSIGSYVYIGPGVKIFGDVCIADNAVLGANSVITKSVEKNGLCLGIPGKIVSYVSDDFKHGYVKK